ncbi:MAG: hypothetical protein H7177_09740 [Rhizobacter sp.]|nr:hypothetical protein [Bacteriovorax sp.]
MSEISKKNDFEYIQWGYDLIQNAYLNKKEELASHDDLYKNYLAPFSFEVYGPTNPFFIYNGHGLMELKDLPSWTLRDGIVPLSIFFKEVTPDQVTSKVFIHKDLWFIVPENWRNKIQFYSIEADNIYDKNNLPEKIFVSGILNSTLAEPEDFNDSLKYLADTLGKENLEEIEIFAYFPDKRNDLWGSWDEENVLKYSKAIFQNLKIDIKVPEWRMIHTEGDYKNCLYHEVNNGLFVKDSYLNHFVLSRGGGLVRTAPQLIDEHFTLVKESRLSIYHKICIHELNYEGLSKYSDPFELEHFAYFKKIIEAGQGNKKLNFHWEKWYASYLKKFFKSKKPNSFI